MSPGTVGVVGVGNMGAAMAANLLERGWAVHVHDIEPARMRALEAAGAIPASAAGPLAQRAELIVIAVVDAAQTEMVLFGERGLTQAGAGTGRTVLLCPTIAPLDCERFCSRLNQHGFEAIDAPMSGGPERARAGTMSLMVACPSALFRRHQPLLLALAERLFHVSEQPGDGARTKLVNNLLAGINLVGAAEALALAGRIGLDPRTTLAVIEQSSGQSWIGSDRLRRALAGQAAARAHMSLLTKDTGLALEMARRAESTGPLGAHAHAVFEAACRDGCSDMDDSALYQLLLQGLPKIER